MGFEVTALRAVNESSRFDLSYTWMVARGTQSREEGVPYGTVLGDRAFPLGEHPLDWDQRHSVVLSILMQHSRWWSLAWSTIVGSPLPWTPRPRREFQTEQADINSRAPRLVGVLVAVRAAQGSLREDGHARVRRAKRIRLAR